MRFLAEPVTRRIERKDAADRWLYFKELAGGGIVHWLGVHWIDLAMYAFGPVRAVSAHLSRPGGSDADVEVHALLTLEMECGAVGTIRTGWTMVPGVKYKDQYIGVEGRHGLVRWHPTPGGGAASASPAASSEEGTLTPLRRHLWLEEFGRQLVASVGRGERGRYGDGRAALAALKVIEAAHRSAESGQRVLVER